ncbi:MAG: polysaccharide deacetylase family protein [Coriobacteriia bacterium]|nr:polysaccharide deacetylase family protein [Coriobacteriia bacterium]
MALGFDDAPQASGPLLLILQQKGVKATFFMIGELVDADPTQALSIASAGMLIGNHSYDHPHFVDATADEIYANLLHAQISIQAATGVTPHWYRSPFLDYNSAYDTVLPELGLQISWPTINPKDWNGTAPQDIINLVRDQEAAGGVVELHDQSDATNTVEALPGLIDGLRADGFDLVTLDDIGFGAIEGAATQVDGSAVSGALVTAYDSNGSPVATASTGVGGGYRIARLAAGPYRIGFSAVGHLMRFYGGASDLAHATPVAVSADYTIAGAGVALPVIDTTPPSTSISPSLPAGWVNHSVSVSMVATDGPLGSGVSATHYRLNGSPAATYTAPVVVAAEGTSTLEYWSDDVSGNVETHALADVRIDKTPPRLSLSAGGSFVGAATIEASASDSLSGLADVKMGLDAGPLANTSHLVASGVGAHTIHARAYDLAGNQQDASVAVTILAPPTPVTRNTTTKLVVPTTVRGTRAFKISGTVSPAEAPGTISIKVTRFRAGRWRNWATARVAISGGRFSYWFKPRYKGSWHFIASYSGRVVGLTTYRGSSSGTKRVAVK